jgi:hypothetical protein
MPDQYRYRGQTITPEQIAFLKQFIASHPGSSRWRLSRQLCEELGWKQANGALRDVVCRGLLLMLERAGQIELPPVRWKIRGQSASERKKPEALLVDTTPVESALGELGRIEIWQVRRTANESFFSSLIEQYHYLGYEQPVGEHLKYLVMGAGRPLGCVALSSAPRHLGPRDRFIGWDQSARKRNIHLIAYNTRFLILPWVKVPHLGSHILGRMARQVSADWQKLYGHPIYLLETFVDGSRYRGTCYRAANWIAVGETTGRGKDDQTNRPNRPLKQILVLPLNRDFRRLLAQ